MSSKERLINLEFVEWEFAPESYLPVGCEIKGKYLLRFLEYIESNYNIKTNYISGPVGYISNLGSVSCSKHHETIHIDDNHTINQYYLINLTEFFSEKLTEALYSSLWLLESYIVQMQCSQFYINRIKLGFDENSTLGQLEIKILYSIYYV